MVINALHFIINAWLISEDLWSESSIFARITDQKISGNWKVFPKFPDLQDFKLLFKAFIILGL